VIYVPRKLWYQKPGDDDRTIVAEDDLPGLSKAIVVLGEPGMGKTELLRRLAKIEGTASCTARKLINTHDPAQMIGNATSLIIDALDEVAADPLGIIEYGDTDAPTQDQARQLFGALRRHASENPGFWRWEGFRARALVSPALDDEIEAVLRDRSTPSDLHALTAESRNRQSGGRSTRIALGAVQTSGATSPAG